MTKNVLKFGLVGCGAMGTVIVKYLAARWNTEARWAGLNDLDQDKAEKLAEVLGSHVACSDLSALVKNADWVVEAASPAAVPSVLKECLRNRANCLVMSSGGLLKCESLMREAAQNGVRVLVPSGAIAGLDAIKASALGRVESVEVTTTEPPKGLTGAPYLMKNNIDVLAIREATVIFEGSVLEAIEGFPTNVNVSATLAMASGIGPAAVRVRVVADPAATRNTHSICVRGSSGTITTRVDNVPSVSNPKTSELAVLAACTAIDDIFNPVRIGT